jgi:hypothetical protein
MILRCPQGMCYASWPMTGDWKVDAHTLAQKAKHASHTFPLRMLVTKVSVSAEAPPRLVAYVGRWLHG